MSQLSQLRSPAAVQAAIDEFIATGRTKFLARHGYGKVPRILVYVIRRPAPIAIPRPSPVAFGKQFPEQGPVHC